MLDAYGRRWTPPGLELVPDFANELSSGLPNQPLPELQVM